jgi:hypothetical protein
MRKLITILSISIILFSCSQNNKKGSDVRDSNEDELINQIFWQLVLPIPDCDQSDSTMEGNEIYASEFYSKLESKPYQIYVQDTLGKPDISDYKTLEVPIEFERLYTNLLNNSTVKPRKINLKPNEISFDIKIITDFNKDSLRFERFESQSILALIEFSRVVFSEDYSKACMQISLIKDKACHQSFIYLIEKQSYKWKFKRRLKLK